MPFRFPLALALALGAGQAAHAADALVPIAAFVERQQFTQPRLSPDGKHIALNVRIMRNGREVPTLSVYTLPELKPVSVIALPGFEIPVNIHWLTATRLIVEKGLEMGLRERPQATGEVVAVNLDGSKQEYLYGYKGFRQSSKGDRYGSDYGYADLAGSPTVRDGHVFLGTHLWEGKHSLLYDINSMTSARKLLADLPMRDTSFLVQNDDTPRFASAFDDDNKPILMRYDSASREWKNIDAKLLGTTYSPFMFSRDDKSFFAWFSEKGEASAIVREDMASGQRTTVVPSHFGSVRTIESSGYPREPFAVSFSNEVTRANYIDPANPDAILHKTLSAAFPDSYVNFINFSDDGQVLLFGVSSDRDPGSYYLYDKKSAKASLLFSNMPGIDPEQMAERRPVRFNARDGMVLSAYLTVPRNAQKKKLPMVLLPHGGPFGVGDDWFFDTDAQFLASRGYAVLQVNFRGSSGRGETFMEAGYREWGGKIMNDLVDGVKWAATQPDIDGNRVCVFGASFGGYAALMLPVREPAMFKCSVGYAGFYDLASGYTQDNALGEVQTKNYLAKTMGTDPAFLADNSPTHLADKITLPVLMVHGSDDKIAELGQAKMMRDALIKAGHPPEWILVANEGHGFYDAEHRKMFYEKLEAFLAKHIGK